MALEDLFNSFLAIGIIAGIAIFIYLKIKKQNFEDFIKEINGLFEKKDGK